MEQSKEYVHIDYETSSELELTSVGSWQYSCHESTDILCFWFSYKGIFYGWDSRRRDDSALYLLAKLFRDPHVIFVAHNAQFEQDISANTFKKCFPELWMPVSHHRWICTMVMCSYYGLPVSLENAALALKLQHKKDVEGRKIMLKMCKPQRPNKEHKTFWWVRDNESYDRLLRYCKDDVRTEIDIFNSLPLLPQSEMDLYVLDRRINQRGIRVDPALAGSAIQINEYLEQKLSGKFVELTGVKPKSHVKVKKWINDECGLSLTSANAKTVEGLLLDKGIPKHVSQALKIRQVVNKSSVSKYKKIVECADPDDNRIRNTLQFYGAHTGRWAGRLLQVHNLPKGDPNYPSEKYYKYIKKSSPKKFYFLFGADSNIVLSSCIRSAIIAPRGKKLIVGDYSQIEARVAAWLAMDDIALQMYRARLVDPYNRMASRIFMREINRKIDTYEGAVGKAAVLGCNYGMGWERFQEYALTYGAAVSEELAKKTVNLFREQYKKIVNLWYVYESLAKKAVLRPGEDFGGFFFWKDKKVLSYLLPSGRELYYQGVEIDLRGKLSYLSPVSTGDIWRRKSFWGGTLLENIDQAISRDLLAYSMTKLNQEGFNIIMHVHDEIIIEESLDVDIKDFEKCIKQLPDWAEDLPLNVSCWEGDRYKKD